MSDVSYGEQVAERLRWVENEWAYAALGSGDRGAADAAVAALAQQVAALDPAIRGEAVAAGWPGEGTASLLDRMSPETRRIVAAEVAERGDLPSALEAALRFDAADVAGLLAPDSVASVLMDAVFAMPEATRYADSMRGAETLADLPAALFGVAAPSLVSRVTALLFNELADRFGEGEALNATRGVLLLRMIRPALSDAPGAALEALLADDPAPDAVRIDDALFDYTAEMVVAGQAAERAAADGEDPDDLVVQRGAALQDAAALASTFREPTPDDKLGTLPAVRVTALGQAILAARARRPSLDDVNWGNVVALQDAEPRGFDAVLLDERCQVLDLIATS